MKTIIVLDIRKPLSTNVCINMLQCFPFLTLKPSNLTYKLSRHPFKTRRIRGKKYSRRAVSSCAPYFCEMYFMICLLKVQYEAWHMWSFYWIYNVSSYFIKCSCYQLDKWEMDGAIK